MNELEIFELGLALAKALGGDKEAIADVALLYQRHPEMFENIKDVVETIEKVIKDPQIITEAKRENGLLALKQLSKNKMGEIAIQNDEGTNIIFHANKKRIKELEKMKQSLVETPAPSTHRSKSAGELMKENPSSGVDTHSMTAKNILPKNPQSKPYDGDKNPKNPKEKTKKRR
ncbi:hypothetical protein [Helicobacter sp. 11S03491-1]|uniref:hypothetical protein n=1 Tax=Helicobacter sp. 11S03491-1 TaxID=1476196 RepID=UPI000BA5B3AD|nr:hypothetical protein [Helicobacter sp. 11S03491-1]PAF42171.1 hypothetical protein BKH45_04280 [Helicobacter sp. 11S03491-1]